MSAPNRPIFGGLQQAMARFSQHLLNSLLTSFMTKSAVRPWERPALLAGVTLVVGFALGAFVLRQATVQAQDLVFHTQQVQRTALELLSALKDTEAGQLGFLLDENAADLETYTEAIAQIPQLQTSLRTLTVDNPEQQSRLDAVDVLVTRRLELLSRPIDFIKTGRQKEALNEFKDATGRRAIVAYRDQIVAVIDAERLLLSERQGSLLLLQNAGLATTLSSFLLSIGLAVAVVTLFQRQASALGLTNLALEYANRKLDQRVAEQRGELQIGEAQRQFALDASQLGEWSLDLATDQSVRSHRHDQIFGYATPVERWGFTEFIQHVVPDDRAAIKASFAETVELKSDLQFECRIVRNGDGAIRWIEGIGRYYDTALSRRRLVGLVADITDRKQLESVLLESEQRFRSTFENAAVGVAHVGIDGRWLRVNQRLADMVGYSSEELIAKTFQDITHPDDHADDADKIRQILSGEIKNYSIDKRYIRKDGTIVWVALTVALQRDVTGAPAYFISVVNDISERKNAVAHQLFLMRELSHRSKNLLAIIQSMAGQTAKSARSKEDFVIRFGQRLQALAASHDVLVDQNWRGAPVRTLVARQLSPFTEQGDKRLILDGPDVTLTAVAAQNVGFALHELATNAVKYGALSVPAGMLRVTWSVDPQTDGSPLFHMSWSEHGGPSVEQPAQMGFGQIVIERMTATAMNGKVSLDFTADGVNWRLDAPASCLATPFSDVSPMLQF